MKLVLLSFALCLASQARADTAAPEEAKTWHRLVGILQYLEADYPLAARSGKASELEEQRAFAQEASEAIVELGPAAAPFAGRMAALRSRIGRAEDPDGVQRDCAALVEDLVAAGSLSRSPRRPPSLAQGEALYLEGCAACHAADGSGKVAIAEEMDPSPLDFKAPEAAHRLTPYRVFNSIGFGVTGTAMPAYPTLTEEERWALSFYVLALRQPPCTGLTGRVSLERLATSTDAELGEALGAEKVACLRRLPPAADEEAALLVARGLVEDALRLSSAGSQAKARQAVVDAYLSGLEPVEPLLRTRDPGLVERLEAAFGKARLSAERDPGALTADARALLTLIDEARRGGGSRGFWSVFWFALLILMREGFEASVVIAALLAVFRRLEQPAQVKVVHAGWISAVVAGGFTFLLARKALAGANRELLEGVTALVAVGMLLYAALWLNARRNLRRFMGELREKVHGALGKGSNAGLFAIAFTSMFRESFETAIFLQGLAIDSPSGAVWGALAGVAALVALVLGVNRIGYKLPMQPLFRASTVLLVTTAVVLLGKGMHALQEVGIFPLRPVPFFQVELLGIFRDAWSLGPQAILTVAMLLLLVRGGTDPGVRPQPGLARDQGR